MAVAIYHGAAGSYKSASAVWFQILPALRAGRVVVTNIDGMKTIEHIEKSLGERFPVSAKIIRVLSNNQNGLKLWQHFYCWCPLGALIVIDEAQDIYNKTVGFDAPKNTYKPIAEFIDYLPAGYLNYYERVFDSFICDDPYTDDTGFSTVDDKGRPVLPLNYNSALMTHRHYNWDIYYLTPDIKQIDASVRGVCERAFHHSSKDNTFLTKRRPRIWEHDPKSSATKPDKNAPMEYRRVPVAVHLMYSSTTTGATTKAGLGKSLFKEWKFLLFLAVMALCITTLIYQITNWKGIGSDYTTDIDAPSTVEETVLPTKTELPPQADTNDSQAVNVISQAVAQGITVPAAASGNVSDSVRVAQSLGEITNFMNAKLLGLEYDFNKIYLSSVTAIKENGAFTYRYLFNSNDRYISSDLLKPMGFEITYLTECLAYVHHSGQGRFVECDHTSKSWNPDVQDTTPVDEPSLIPFGQLANNVKT